MLEAFAIRGSLWPGALFARSTPGIDVVWIAILPFFATTVPGAGAVPAAGAVLFAPVALLLPVVFGVLPFAALELAVLEL